MITPCISTVEKNNRRRGCMLQHLVLPPLCKTNMKSWQAAVFCRLLIHRRAGLGTLAQSLGRPLAVADRAGLLNAPYSASRRLRLLLLLIHPKVSPLTEWSCRLQVQAHVLSRRKMLAAAVCSLHGPRTGCTTVGRSKVKYVHMLGRKNANPLDNVMPLTCIRNSC